MKVLGELGMDWLNVVGVAKGRSRRPGAEQLFRPGESRAMTLPPDSPALLLIQQIVDPHFEQNDFVKLSDALYEVTDSNPHNCLK